MFVLGSQMFSGLGALRVSGLHGSGCLGFRVVTEDSL